MDGQDDSTQSEWGLFGRPLFKDPKARALSRVGVVDIGSNSVRLVVFDGAARSPAYFYNEKIMCALGAGMSETGRLNPHGRRRALEALRRFQTLARGMHLAPLTAVATAAVREASDGPEFREEVYRETGLRIWVIDGEEEARLSAQGVLLGWPGSYGLVCDIGGSSMELARIAEGRVGRRMSSDLGPLKLRDLDGPEARRVQIARTLAKLSDHMDSHGDRMFLVGGSWRAIARIDMERRGYPLHVLHEYRMTLDGVAETVDFIRASDLDDLRARCAISAARMSLVPYAADVLQELISTFKPRDIAISSYGIREGLLYEQMPQRLRDRDPLIESCRFSEAKDARLPGFGKKLHRFVRPLFPDADPARDRLIKAACLLHDVSWRAHPDYRAEICFSNVTLANLGGIKHSERVFVGLALLHRYKNKRQGTRFDALLDLISAEDVQAAEILGKAMRFGAMLWMSDTTDDGTRLHWEPANRRLRLELTPASAPLFGEVAEARLNSLAAAMSAEVEITQPA